MIFVSAGSKKEGKKERRKGRTKTRKERRKDRQKNVKKGGSDSVGYERQNGSVTTWKVPTSETYDSEGVAPPAADTIVVVVAVSVIVVVVAGSPKKICTSESFST